jgi:hypothetical protein
MKYKVGDKVRIKSLDWYNANKDENGRVYCDYIGFCKEMTKYCGKVLTIMTIGNQDIGSKQKYFMHETDCAWGFTDDMIEGLAGEEPQEKMVSLDKACEWIEKNFRSDGYFSLYYVGGSSIYTPKNIAKDFRKAMEE